MPLVYIVMIIVVLLALVMIPAVVFCKNEIRKFGINLERDDKNELDVTVNIKLK